MNHPRLLIINNYSFNQYKGGGITLKNLFTDWPIEKLAIAHLDNSEPLPQICANYYKLGYLENHYIFPLNLFSHEQIEVHGTNDKSVRMRYSGRVIGKDSIVTTKVRNSLIRNSILDLINKTGIYDLIHPLKISREFIEWVSEFNPEVIYCQPENISFINFILNINKIFNVKVVIHFMDDWPSIRYNDKLFKSYLRLLLMKKVKKLLKISSLRLGISELMAEEYTTRYNVPFSYFHNPFDSVISIKYDKRMDQIGSDFKVVYSGRIGVTACYNTIIDFCKCVETLNSEGFNISFSIFTDLENREIDFSDFNFKGTYLWPSLSDDDFMLKLCDANLLLYPVDFDDFSVDFIRLSFPTKLPAYLFSKTPILAYGPKSVYSIRFMIENRLGFTCTNSNPLLLKEAVLNALTNNEARSKYSNNALIYAMNSFDAKKIRQAFHLAIYNCMKEK